MLELPVIIGALVAFVVATIAATTALHIGRNIRKVNPLFNQIDTELRETNSSTAARLDRLDYFFKMTIEGDAELREYITELHKTIDELTHRMEAANHLTADHLQSLEYRVEQYAHQGLKIDDTIKDSLHRLTTASERIRHMEADLHHLMKLCDLLTKKQDHLVEAYLDRESTRT